MFENTVISEIILKIGVKMNITKLLQSIYFPL